MQKTTTYYIAVLVQQARTLGLDVERILEETEIPAKLAEDRQQLIDINYFTRLVKTMWRETQCEGWRFDPQPMKIGTWALASEFMLTAETLGDLLRKGEHIMSFMPSNTGRIATVTEGDNVKIILNTYVGDNDPDHFLVEFMSVAWHRFPCWAINETIALNSAFFSYSEPAHSNVHEELYHCPISYQQKHNGISFHKRYLSKPVVRNKSELQQWLRNSPADLMYMPGREKSIRSHIKIYLLDNLNESMRFPAFSTVCNFLAMSPQVVRRRLSEEGTSYQGIKNSIRCDLSMELLANPDLMLTDIAERTGFSEAASLSRAFKKWTGVSPAQYREHKLSTK